MSTNNNNNNVIKNGTLLSNHTEDTPSEMKFKSLMMHLFPSVVGSLICLPFGIMLGWPSPTYPKLLPQNSPIPLTPDQTAMVAGFLMIGNILGTPLSSTSFFGNKYGIVLGMCGMLLGWVLMWLAADIYYLLSSRLIIGISFGYAVGQLKMYIIEISKFQRADILLKSVNFFVFFGVIVAYLLGYFLTFTTFSFVVMNLTAVLIVICLLLPHSAKEYLRFGKTKEAETMIKSQKSDADVGYEVQQLFIDLMLKVDDLSFSQVLKVKKLRYPFVCITLLTFFQQFTGAPATIVYAQIILVQLSYAEVYAIAYAIVFFISNLIGVFYVSQFNKKYCLLLSSAAVCATLLLNMFVCYYNLNEAYWKYSALVSMFLFIIFHSIGLAVIPVMLIPDYFPAPARSIVSKFQIMCHSAFAIIITKVFQVLFYTYDLYVSFVLFFCVSIICTIFIIMYIPTQPLDDEEFKSSISV